MISGFSCLTALMLFDLENSSILAGSKNEIKFFSLYSIIYSDAYPKAIELSSEAKMLPGWCRLG